MRNVSIWFALLILGNVVLGQGLENKNGELSGSGSQRDGDFTVLYDNFDDGDYTSNPHWEDWTGNFAPGTTTIIDGELRILRTGAGTSGQSAGLMIPVDHGVHTNTRVYFDVKPSFSSVTGGDGFQHTEYPALLRMFITRADETTMYLTFAYNYRGGHDINTPTHVQIANGDAEQNVWLRNENFRILDHVPDAQNIDSMCVCGAGWDFEGWFDNIRIDDVSEEYQDMVFDDFNDGDYLINPVWNPFYANIAPGSITVIDGETQILRSGAGGAGRTTGLSLPVNRPVTNETIVHYDVKATYSNVINGSGNANNEFPANVSVYLKLLDGTSAQLRHSYNYRGGSDNIQTNFYQIGDGWIDQDVWLRNESYCIRDYFPEAAWIDSLAVYGSGWDFESWYDNVGITDDISSSTIIDNDIVYISFNNDWAAIDAITWKSGSNQDLLDQYWNGTMNKGIGRLGGQTGCTLENYMILENTAWFEYSHPVTGSKVFTLDWSETGGISAVIQIDNSDVNEYYEGAVWEPGGDNDGNDDFRVFNGDFEWNNYHFTYPGPSTPIYNWEDAWIVGLWDTDYNEVAGYYFDEPHQLYVGNGVSADGPFWQIFQGMNTLHFAIKTDEDFWAWAHPTSDLLPPAPVTDLQIQTSGGDANLSWTAITENIFGDSITDVIYIVQFEEQIDEEWNFLAVTSELSYTHADVVDFAGSMFYKIVAISDPTGRVASVLNDIDPNTSWRDVKLIMDQVITQ